MADYASPASISLSQPRHGGGGGGGDLSPASENESSDRTTPPRATTSTKSLRRPISTSDPPKKPRGRPPGSKNKPKPPVVITKELAEGAMRPVVLEISAGSDVVDSVVSFANKRRVGLTLLSGSGSVSNVTLRHPLSHGPAMSLHGPFSLLSLSGSVLAGEPSPSSPATPPFGICLAGAQGQVFGGVVGGKVVAAGAVVVVAATFASPSPHRIPGNDDHEQESKQAGAEAGSTSGSMTVYSSGGGGGVASPGPINCQLASPDHHHHHVMPGWGHSSRSPY